MANSELSSIIFWKFPVQPSNIIRKAARGEVSKTYILCREMPTCP